MSRKLKSSTARNPFSSYVEIGLSLAINEDVFKDSFLNSAPYNEYDIDMESYLSDCIPPLKHTSKEISEYLSRVDLPLASTLVQFTADIFAFMKRMAAAPTGEEVADQVNLMQQAAIKLGSLAQGGNGRGPIASEPEWLTRLSDNPKWRQYELHVREHLIRTNAIHPHIQDQIGNIFNIIYKKNTDDSTERDQESEQIQDANLAVVVFFSMIPQIIHWLKLTEAECRGIDTFEQRRRKVGAPRDHARDWALVRLMWIWRDALGRELTIYLPKSTNEPIPEAGSLIAFVVEAMTHLEPVAPHQLEALEQQLIRLRPLIPKTLLVELRSRQN